MLHKMKLNDLPFTQIKEGIKLIEVRLNDDKRKKLKIGDAIEFTNNQTGKKIVKNIIDLKKYDNFEELFLDYDFVLFGGRGYTLEQMVDSMYQIYQPVSVKEFGVLAIFLNDEVKNFREQLIIRSYPFEGRLLRLRNDLVKLPNNSETSREWIEHPGASAIVVVDSEDNIYMERQFRYPLGKTCLEIPAGKLNDALEPPIECAKRELLEETGLVADEIGYLGKTHNAIAYSNEVIYLYYVNKFTTSSINLDEDEIVEVIKIPFFDVYQKVLNGEITDAKSMTAILLYKEKIWNKKNNG